MGPPRISVVIASMLRHSAPPPGNEGCYNGCSPRGKKRRSCVEDSRESDGLVGHIHGEKAILAGDMGVAPILLKRAILVEE